MRKVSLIISANCLTLRFGSGEGNSNPLQCSGLENPRDGGAWWAAVCGVAQSRTRLKRLGSSSSSRFGRDRRLSQGVTFLPILGLPWTGFVSAYIYYAVCMELTACHSCLPLKFPQCVWHLGRLNVHVAKISTKVPLSPKRFPSAGGMD